MAAAALTLGAGGLIAVNVSASAGENGADNTIKRSSPGRAGQAQASTTATIDCPDVGIQLSQVPDGARAEVDRELALLDQQIAEAYRRLRSSARAIQQDGNFANNAIIGPLKDKRKAAIDRTAIAIGRGGDRPQGLESLAPSALRAAVTDRNGQGQNRENGQEPPAEGAQGGNGPVAADFVDITTVRPNVKTPRKSRSASRGKFTTRCGVNENKLYNSDDIIVAPGVSNGAHHTHDYVGNQANTAFASDEDFAAGATTCSNQGAVAQADHGPRRLRQRLRRATDERRGPVHQHRPSVPVMVCFLRVTDATVNMLRLLCPTGDSGLVASIGSGGHRPPRSQIWAGKASAKAARRSR